MQHMASRAEVEDLCSTLKLDVLALQEHRIILSDKGEPSTIKGEIGFTFHLLSAEFPSACGGVGVVLSSRAARAVTNIQVIDPKAEGGSRILVITFALVTARKLHVIACYSPTSNSVAEAEEFYNQLGLVIAAQPARDVTITLGDLNASLPRIPIRALYPVGTPNGNAPLLAELLDGQDLVSVNSNFRKKTAHRSTFHGPRQRRVRLDHILVHCKWSRCFMDAKVIAPRLVPSDHRLVWCKWKMREQLYRPRQASQMRFWWSALRNQPHRRIFEDHLDAQLLGINGEITYNHLSNSIMTAASQCLPVMQSKGNRGLPWTRDEEVRRAREQWMRATSGGRKNHKKEEEYKLKVEELIKKETGDIARLNENQKVHVAWKLLRRFTGKKSQESSLVVHGDTPEERSSAVRTFFAQLLSAPVTPAAPLSLSVVEELRALQGDRKNFNTDPIKRGEVMQAALKIGAGKAPGPDGIPIECFRLPLAAASMCRLMNGVMREGRKAPAEWRVATIIPIPKKPNARSLDQHRGISLMNLSAKLFNRVLLDRVRPHVDPLLRPEQNGFRKGRSTIHHILTLRRITEEAVAHKLELHMIFVDFRKAFDSVSRTMLPAILDAYGIPLCLQVAICSLYEETSASVRTGDGMTTSFATESGVLQGDILAPFLFTLFIDLALRGTITSEEDGFVIDRRRSTRHPAKYITVLAYADDIVLLSSSATGAQNMLTRLETVCKGLGLSINTQKTKSVSINSPSPVQYTTADGAVESCSSFLYLGSILPSSAEDFSRRKGLAWGMMGKLRPLWQANLSIEARMRLFQSIIVPVFSYAADTWTLTKPLEKQVEAAYMRLLRSALSITWQQHMSNAQVLSLSGTPSFCDSLRDKRRYMVAKVQSGEWSHLPYLSQVLLWCPGKHAGIIHPAGKTTYVDMLLRDAEGKKCTWEEWFRTAQSV
jgi:exonuclease III